MMRYLLSCLIALLLVGGARPVAANPRDEVPGEFYFYDRRLDKETDGQNKVSGIGQAKIVECQGHAEVFEWNDGDGRCLRFTPAKIGDSISFQIHISRVDTDSACAVETNMANFDNEGIYQLLVNDQPAGPPHDCFDRSRWKHGEYSVQPGDYKITYRYKGKNPKSSGSVLNICRLSIG